MHYRVVGPMVCYSGTIVTWLGLLPLLMQVDPNCLLMACGFDSLVSKCVWFKSEKVVLIALCNVGLLQVLCIFDKVCATDFVLDC